MEGHPAFFVFVRGVPTAERNLFMGERDQPMVGNGDAVRVTAQITKCVLWAAEGALRIDHPNRDGIMAEVSGERLGLSEEGEISVEAELAIGNSSLERRHELAAKDPAQHFDGKEEEVTGFDPARVTGRQPAGRNHAMRVRMMFQFLVLGMEHAEEADLCAEMPGVGGNFQKRFSAGLEQ